MPEETTTWSRTTKLRKQVRQAGDFLRRTPSFLPSRNTGGECHYASPCMSERRRWIPSSKTSASLNVTPRQPLRTLASTPQCHLARRSSTFYVPAPAAPLAAAAAAAAASSSLVPAASTPATPRIATYRRIYSPEWQQVPQMSNDAPDDVTTCPLLASASDTSSGCESGTP